MSKKSSALKGYAIVNVTDTGDGLLISDADIERYGLQYDKHYEGEFLPDGRYKVALPYPAMTNAKPEELQVVRWQRKSTPTWGWIEVHEDDLDYYKSQGAEIRGLILHSEAAALISQLTADRDAALENEKAFGDWQKEAARAYNANLRAEFAEKHAAGLESGAIELHQELTAAEKRVKELEEGRDLDKVVLDEGIEIINELETSNKLLSKRVAVLEAEIERMTPNYVAYDYLESPARAEMAEDDVKLLENALEDILKKDWSEYTTSNGPIKVPGKGAEIAARVIEEIFAIRRARTGLEGK